MTDLSDPPLDISPLDIPPLATTPLSSLSSLSARIQSLSLSQQSSLTLLVRSRYRDLLHVADDIAAMRTTASATHRALSHLSYSPSSFPSPPSPDLYSRNTTRFLQSTTLPILTEGMIHELSVAVSEGALTNHPETFARAVYCLEATPAPLPPIPRRQLTSIASALVTAARNHISSFDTTDYSPEDLLVTWLYVLAITNRWDQAAVLQDYLSIRTPHGTLDAVLSTANATVHHAIVVFGRRFASRLQQDAGGIDPVRVWEHSTDITKLLHHTAVLALMRAGSVAKVEFWLEDTGITPSQLSLRLDAYWGKVASTVAALLETTPSDVPSLVHTLRASLLTAKQYPAWVHLSSGSANVWTTAVTSIMAKVELAVKAHIDTLPGHVEAYLAELAWHGETGSGLFLASVAAPAQFDHQLAQIQRFLHNELFLENTPLVGPLDGIRAWHSATQAFTSEVSQAVESDDRRRSLVEALRADSSPQAIDDVALASGVELFSQQWAPVDADFYTGVALFWELVACAVESASAAVLAGATEQLGTILDRVLARLESVEVAGPVEVHLRFLRVVVAVRAYAEGPLAERYGALVRKVLVRLAVEVIPESTGFWPALEALSDEPEEAVHYGTLRLVFRLAQAFAGSGAYLGLYGEPEWPEAKAMLLEKALSQAPHESVRTTLTALFGGEASPSLAAYVRASRVGFLPLV